MKITTFIILQFCFLVSSYSQPFISLWPEAKMPNSRGMKLEHVEERERITQVKTPGMYAFYTSKEENSGSAVLIFPSGGYKKLTYNIGGFQLAKWFNTIGINAFVVIYRLPTSPDLEHPEHGPIQDAQRAMKIVRNQSIALGIDRDRIGVMGSSAGGHLAAAMCTFTQDLSIIGDSIDNITFQPNFQILVSAAISFGEYGHKGSREAMLGENPTKEMVDQFSNELNVVRGCAPAFIVHASDDQVVNPMNSIIYFQTLQEHDVNACLHIFPQGGHSIAIRNNPGSTNLWTTLCEAWLKETGILR